MKTIGICIATIEGGVVCHQEIGREAARRGIDYPEIVTHTPLYASIGRAIAEDDFSQLSATLVDSIDLTAAAGAQFAIIPSNTMHIVFEEVASRTAIPILSIIEVAADHCKKRDYGRVGVLGTRPTMERRLFDRALAEHGIETVYPSKSDTDALAQIISDELIKGVFLGKTRERLETMAQTLGLSADAIVLGCTELPLIMTEAGCRAPLIDTTRILAHAALDVAAGDSTALQMTKSGAFASQDAS